jgi:hypothetical protein
MKEAFRREAKVAKVRRDESLLAEEARRVKRRPPHGTACLLPGFD